MNLMRFCCLSLLLASSALLQAQRVEISPFYGYRFGGEVQDMDTGETYAFKDAPAYGLFLDFGPADSDKAESTDLDILGATDADMRLELLWSRQDSSVNFGGYSLGKVDLTIDEFQIGSIVETGTKRFREYISAHAGVTVFSLDGYDSDVKFSIGVGVGGKVILTRNIQLRADFRGFCTVVEAEGGFISNSSGAVIVFSGSSLWQGQASIGVSVVF